MVSELVVRKIVREKVSQFRDISQKREPVRFTWVGKSWNVRIMQLQSSREDLLDLCIDWGGACVKFRCDERWLAQIVESMLGINGIELLQKSWKLIVIEAAFAQISSEIERSTRKRFVLHDSLAFPGAVEWEKFSAEFSCNGMYSISEIWLDQLGVGFLSTALRECPLSPIDWMLWKDLPVRVRFQVGSTRLPITSLRELSRRDVILLDECGVGSQLDELLVEFGETFVSFGKISGKKITMFSTLEKRMEEINEVDLDRQEAYGELSIRLCFDLGERSVRLSELTQIGPGYVFDLGRDLRREVFIRANGKIIGEGQLVDIDGQIGVAVLQLDPSLSVARE